MSTAHPVTEHQPLRPDRAEALRRILASLPQHPATFGGREAAVLVPLYEAHGRVHVVLTLRSEAMPTHAGQISFPGGARDHADDDLLATAIRETTEEIGLPAGSVASLGLLGTLPTYATEFVVSAFVASIVHPGDWVPSEAEIDEIIELPMDALAAARTTEVRERDGIRWRMPVFEVEGHRVWGFTAFILARLLDLAAPVLVEDAPEQPLVIHPASAERIVDELHDSDDLFDWTGISWTVGDERMPGPFRGVSPRPRSGAATVSVPIVLEGSVVGMLDVDSNSVDAFDGNRLAMIEAAAARIAALAERSSVSGNPEAS